MPLSTSLVSRLQHQHETIAELIDGFSELQLKRVSITGKWSAFENIAHLAAYQPTHIHRLAVIIQTDQPTFERYIAENDPLFHTYLRKSLSKLLDDIHDKRSLLISFLTALDDEQLKLKGIHPKYGSLTISQWTEFFLLHEAHHLWTIFQLISGFRDAAHE